MNILWSVVLDKPISVYHRSQELYVVPRIIIEAMDKESTEDGDCEEGPQVKSASAQDHVNTIPVFLFKVIPIPPIVQFHMTDDWFNRTYFK